MAKSRSAKASFKDYLTLKSQLASTNSPLIGIHGSSDALIESAFDAVRDRAKTQSAEITSLEGASLNEEKFTSIVSQTSLFDPVTFYIVRRAEQAKSLAKLLKNISHQQLTKSWTHRLILIWSGVDPSAAVAGELVRLKAFILPCMEPWPNEIPQAIEMYASGLGLKLTPDAVQLMIEAFGLDLMKHRHEINKISLVKPDSKGPLNREDIAPLIGILREDDAFQLDRLLIQGKWGEAQALLESLLGRGEKALGIISIVANHCRNVLKIKEAISKGGHSTSLAQETRLPTFVLKNYLPLAEKADASRYSHALQLCHKADLLLKSKPLAESLIVSQVIETLARPR